MSTSEEKKRMWKEIYEAPNKGIFDHFGHLFKLSNNNYSIDDNLEECFIRYSKQYSNIKRLNSIIRQELEKICKKCSDVFCIKDIELNFITMVGLFQANSFVTQFNGTTSFYFLEQMPEEKYLEILLTHEITHLFQFSQLLKEEYNPTIADYLFIEGFACFSSSVINQGFSKAEYLGFNNSSNQWLLDCEKYLPVLKSELIANIESTDYFYYMRYFTGNNEYTSGIPERIGYVVGYNVISYLNKTYSIDELILWDSDKIKKEVKDAIDKIISN